MGNRLVFDILPFNPLVEPNGKARLPIDLNDLAHRLRDKYPDGEVHIVKFEDESVVIRLYISVRNEPWNIAGFIEDGSQFYVEGYPKRIAKEIIAWYRDYVPSNSPLFLVEPDSGFVVELKTGLSPDHVEKMYLYPVPDE